VTETTQEPFRLGRVISRSFSIWRRNLVLLFALVLVVSSPRILSEVYQQLVPPADPEYGGDDSGSFFWFLLPYLLRDTGMNLVRDLFVRLSEAAVIFAVYQRLRGETATFSQSFRGGLRRILPVVRVALALFVLSTVMWHAYLFVLWEGRFDLPGSIGYLVWALILLALSPFWVAVPAAVVERSGSFLKRSWNLTRGHRLRVFLIALILYAIDWGVWQLFLLVAPGLPVPLRMVVWWTQDLLLVAFAAVLAVVGYRALRLEKDGPETPAVAEVFA
jgi:hypothetical protein